MALGWEMVSNLVTWTVTVECARVIEGNEERQEEREAEMIGKDKWKGEKDVGFMTGE